MSEGHAAGEGEGEAGGIEGFTIGQLLRETGLYPVSEVLTGGASVLAVIGARMLRRIGEPPVGRAAVRIDVAGDGTAALTLTWGGE